jgi:hypothetical protein
MTRPDALLFFSSLAIKISTVSIAKLLQQQEGTTMPPPLFRRLML